MRRHFTVPVAMLTMPFLVPVVAVDMSQARVPPARDGDVAIAQELEAARKSRSITAYDLFIERHPDHRLVDIARRERDRLADENKQAPDK